MSEAPTYSIVAPVYNEIGNLRPFTAQVRAVMDGLGEPWELLLVDDGSSDGSRELMLDLAAADPRLRVISFARNFGHQVAVTAGVDYASGRAVVLIDADLQDPPAVIPRLIEKWQEGYDVVYAVRAVRRGESWLKRLSAKLFYRLLHRITDINIPVDTGDFRLMDARVAAVLRQMREQRRFVRGMTSWAGFRQTGIEYVREERAWGETKYPLRKMIAFALDAVTSFSFFPLQIMIVMSLFLGVASLLTGLAITILRLTRGEEFFGGQATTIILLLLLSSFQLFFLFVIGQYVARGYDEARDRPLYVVASTVGLGPPRVANQRLPMAGGGEAPALAKAPGPRQTEGEQSRSAS
ncbi:MAG: glycosyltransferase family 2 protein [Chloroflexi bacterium]|nr:glycosyltransferase family 2 protein [Chloroflexota bacterium]MCY4246983.1 glycosyltransferase family 2 protein [Chloroflexota bacterium]